MPQPNNDTRKLIITAGDRLHQPAGDLTKSDGTPYNLEGLTLAFRMVAVNSGDVIVDNQPAVSIQTDADPNTWGRCTYEWQAGDTDEPGLYRACFIVTAEGLSTHFPPDGTFYILIQPNT